MFELKKWIVLLIGLTLAGAVSAQIDTIGPIHLTVVAEPIVSVEVPAVLAAPVTLELAYTSGSAYDTAVFGTGTGLGALVFASNVDFSVYAEIGAVEEAENDISLEVMIGTDGSAPTPVQILEQGEAAEDAQLLRSFLAATNPSHSFNIWATASLAGTPPGEYSFTILLTIIED